MFFAGGQFFGGSDVEGVCELPDCGEEVSELDPGEFAFAGAESQVVIEGSCCFLWLVFLVGLAFGLLAGFCLLGGWAEEGLVVSGVV